MIRRTLRRLLVRAALYQAPRDAAIAGVPEDELRAWLEQAARALDLSGTDRAELVGRGLIRYRAVRTRRTTS